MKRWSVCAVKSCTLVFAPLLTRHDFLTEEQGLTYLAEADRESSLLPLQAA